MFRSKTGTASFEEGGVSGDGTASFEEGRVSRGVTVSFEEGGVSRDGTVSFEDWGLWGCGAHTRFLAGREKFWRVGGEEGVRDSLRFLVGKGEEWEEWFWCVCCCCWMSRSLLRGGRSWRRVVEERILGLLDWDIGKDGKWEWKCCEGHKKVRFGFWICKWEGRRAVKWKGKKRGRWEKTIGIKILSGGRLRRSFREMIKTKCRARAWFVLI